MRCWASLGPRSWRMPRSDRAPRSGSSSTRKSSGRCPRISDGALAPPKNAESLAPGPGCLRRRLGLLLPGRCDPGVLGDLVVHGGAAGELLLRLLGLGELRDPLLP